MSEFDKVKAPAYWKGSVEDVEQIVKKVKKGKVSILCKSPGNRPIYMVEYGKKNELKRTANYSSGLSARSMKYYADKTGNDYKPCLLLVGATHGNEWEGTVALNNLINLIETGYDLEGKKYDEIIEAIGDINLLIIPCLNPDGRARIPLETMAGQSFEKFRYYSQGTWKKDGTLCNWPMCKSVHPIKEASDFLGGYFDDNGVNIMVDNFFFPMSEATKAILRLADEYVPDLTILFHGGDNTVQGFFPFDYVPGVIRNRIRDFSAEIAKSVEKAGIDPTHFAHTQMPSHQDDERIPAFTLTSAWTALCGEACVTYESNQGLDAPNSYTMEEIYIHHRILFETAFKYIKTIDFKGRY